MEQSSYESGTPCWVDLGAADPAAAIGFYSKLFGWEAGDPHPEAGGYRLFLRGGKPVAGIGPKQGDGPSHWTTYISVADAEATTARVLVVGGQVHVEPMDVMTEGRMAVYSDSAGAGFAVWQPKAHHGSAVVGEPGSMCWHELGTRNAIAATDFYREVFDWLAEVQEVEGHQYTLFKLGDHHVAGMLEMDDRWPAEAPSYWMPYFAVEDCEATVSQISAAGGSTLSGPRDVPQGRFAVVTDPEGAPFGVMRLSSAG